MALRVAIVGMGGIGNTHGSVYQKRPDCEIVAVCDMNKERAGKAAERYGCPGFYAVKELLGSGIRIDAASMCTAGKENGGDHYEPTMELLAAGIPTLGEKPISNEISKAREMVALLAKMRDAGKTIFVVTHQAALLEGAADEFVWMEAGRIVSRTQRFEQMTSETSGAGR